MSLGYDSLSEDPLSSLIANTIFASGLAIGSCTVIGVIAEQEVLTFASLSWIGNNPVVCKADIGNEPIAVIGTF